MSTIAELELASAQFDPMIEAATDPAVIKELQAAQFLVDSAIMDKINAGEKYTPPRKESTTQAKSEGKTAMKAALKRILAEGGQAALNFALSLPNEMPVEEVERTALRAAKDGALTPQRSSAIAAIPAVRAATPQAESAWARETREQGEAAFQRMFGKLAPKTQLSPEQMALHQSFASVAMRAAGLTHTEDGQKRFRSSRPDEEDERLFLAGQASAKRLWSGR